MTSTLRAQPDKNDHILGPLHAPVMIVEYGDYECPYSSTAAPALEQIIQELKPNICFIYRHFPMRTIHPMSYYAAQAAEAADRQGLFWKMHKELFAHSENLSREVVDRIAEDIGLNMNLYHQDLEREEIRKKIDFNILSGVQSEVSSTPSIFINDLQYEGSSSYFPLRETIENYLSGSRSAYL